MAYNVKETEHAGAKKGRGFWGRKVEAKLQSSRIRRRHDKEELYIGLSEVRSIEKPAEREEDEKAL